jgi:hypothetical protein
MYLWPKFWKVEISKCISCPEPSSHALGCTPTWGCSLHRKMCEYVSYWRFQSDPISREKVLVEIVAKKREKNRMSWLWGTIARRLGIFRKIALSIRCSTNCRLFCLNPPEAPREKKTVTFPKIPSGPPTFFQTW